MTAMKPFAGTYKNKRVLVTGHTGFKGSWLVSWLVRMGAEVCGYSDTVPTQPSLFEAASLAARIRHETGDIRDAARLKSLLLDFRPDFVFHLAAQAIVSTSYADPLKTIDVNVMGTACLLEALRSADWPCVAVIITSDKAYFNTEWLWGYRENDRLGGKDVYSASKGAAELIFASYWHSYFAKDGVPVRLATARAGNVIGGGDWAADRIVPDCARAWSEGREVEIRSPHATRPWQHVLEPLSGYLWLGAKLFAAHRDAVKAGKGDGCHEGFRLDGEAFNFGPSSDASHTVADVVQSLESQWSGFGSKMDLAGQAGMKECTLLKLCCDKALACLNWRATLDFDTTMRFTAKWYEVFYREQGADIYAFTQSQIQDYCRKAAALGLPWSSDGIRY